VAPSAKHHRSCLHARAAAVVCLSASADSPFATSFSWWDGCPGGRSREPALAGLLDQGFNQMTERRRGAPICAADL
jgi:hypothetical protein